MYCCLRVLPWSGAEPPRGFMVARAKTFTQAVPLSSALTLPSPSPATLQQKCTSWDAWVPPAYHQVRPHAAVG
jgi:hypothetical protein